VGPETGVKGEQKEGARQRINRQRTSFSNLKSAGGSKKCLTEEDVQDERGTL